MSNKNYRERKFSESKKEREEIKEVQEKKFEPDNKTDELKTEVKEEKPVEPEIKTGVVNTDLLNVRTSPEVGDNILGTFVKGTKVTIVTKSEGWFFVKGDMRPGVTISGYVMSKYIKED